MRLDVKKIQTIYFSSSSPNKHIFVRAKRCAYYAKSAHIKNKLAKTKKALNSSTFSGLDELRTLRLGWNKISHLHRNAFSGVYKLESIFLDHNHIKTVHPTLFR